MVKFEWNELLTLDNVRDVVQSSDSFTEDDRIEFDKVLTKINFWEQINHFDDYSKEKGN